MQIKEVLIVINNNVKYGIDTSVIEQILHVPDLTDIPYAPSYTRGLCSISGSIVSAIDFSLLLNCRALDLESDKARTIVLNHADKRSALLVSEVINSITLDPEQMDENSEDDLFNLGTYKHEDGLIQILDIFQFFSLIESKKIDIREVVDGSNKAKVSTQKKSDTQRYLLFLMGHEQFALSVDYLQEIIALPETFTHIAGSQEYVAGMISLRDELLVVNDIREYYSYKHFNGIKNKILVTEIDNKKLGLIVDEIVDIKDFDLSLVDEMPANFQDEKVSGVIHNDEQLISIIGESILNKIMCENDRFTAENHDDDTKELVERSVDIEVVVFKLHDIEYAFNIEHVDEIIDMSDITTVADTPEIIEGLINIRGKIVTMASLFNALNLEAKMSENQKILICNINNNKVGFNVDQITDVIGINNIDIKPDSEETSNFSNVLHLDNGNRLVLMIDIMKVMNLEDVA